MSSRYCDIASDPKLFVKDNVKRNRRIASVVLILGGAIAGGWIMKASAMSTVLWLAAGIKAVVTISWLFWPEAGNND